jgi:hypothetical protein
MTNKLQEMSEDVQNRVREVAYLMWESAGRHQGMALEYWLAAEREVLATMQRAAERLMPLDMVKRATAAAKKVSAAVAPAPQQPAPAPAPAETAAAEAPADQAPAAAAEAPSRAKKAPTRGKTRT